MDSFAYGHDEMSWRGIVVSVDRGYRSLELLRHFLGREMCGVMIIMEHLLKFHPLAAVSNYNATTVDNETETYYEIGGEDGEDSDSHEDNCEDHRIDRSRPITD